MESYEAALRLRWYHWVATLALWTAAVALTWL